MSDTPDTSMVTPVTPVGADAQQQAAAQVAAKQQAAKGDDGEKVTLSREEYEQLTRVSGIEDRLAKLEQSRQSRPPSTVEQLQAQLDEAKGLRSDSAQEKGRARDVTNEADRLVHELREERHKLAVMNAATAAGFIDPADATLFVPEGTEDISAAVTDLAKSKPHLVKRTTDSDPARQSARVPEDPTVAALAKTIADSRR